MAVTLKLVLGTVNYTDYLRVSAAKVSDPGTEVFVEYIDVPVSSYVLTIPGLDPDDYYITFRDAPTTSDLGTLISQALVNAQTGEFEYERRFYTVGSLTGGASMNAGMTELTDTYLQNKNVTGVFKEGFRYMEEDTEWEFDDTTGKITLLYGQFSNDEKFIVEIKYNVGASTSTVASGIFTETITVDASTYTVDAADKYKRHCLDCSGATQVVTLCPLSSLATGDFFYFEHKREGVQAQSKIVVDGSDRILYNGLNYSTNELEELWLAKGESLYLRKEDTYWEVIFDYAGHRVGERMAATYKDHPNYLPEDGRLCDGDEYPALWWWINNVLPSTHVITDDTVVTGGYAHPAAKVGLFVKHSSLKKFRLPNTQNVGERGLLDFDSYGADTNRSYDYPGGYQGDVVGPFTMTATVPKGYSYTGSPNNDRFGNGSSTPQNVAISGISVTTGNSETRVKNIGVIYLRRI